MYINIDSRYEDAGYWSISGSMDDNTAIYEKYDHNPTLEDIAKALTQLLAKYQEDIITRAKEETDTERLSLGIGKADRRAIDGREGTLLFRTVQDTVPQTRARRTMRNVREQEYVQVADVPTRLRLEPQWNIAFGADPGDAAAPDPDRDQGQLFGIRQS